MADVNLTGKVALLTGATEGIGKAAAHALARSGATLVLVARNREKGERVVRELVEQSGNGRIELLVADLSSQRSVRALAEAFRAKYDRLDLLLNNAGAIFTDREVTEDGLERTFALNHVAYFLLTTLLLDLLKKSAPARIVNVSSAAHAGSRMNLDDLQSEKSWSGFGAYSQSKLANILFTRELARRLEGTGVTVNALHPGVVRSGFGLNTAPWFRWGVKLLSPLFITPEKGADTLVWLATSPDVEGRTGGYYAKRRLKTPGRGARDDEAARRLWETTEQLVGRPRATANA